MKRLILAASAAALVVLAAAVPVFAQDDPESPPPPEPVPLPENQFWSGSITVPDPAETSTFDVSGQFTYKRENYGRTLVTRVSTAEPEGMPETCRTGMETAQIVKKVSPDDDPLSEDAKSIDFTALLTSPCNRSVDMTVTVVACYWQANADRCSDETQQASVTKTVTVDAPPVPVEDVIASVEDTETKDVNVSWTLPEGAEHDATYSVERAGPDPGDEPQWTTIAPAEPEEPAEGEVAEEPTPLESPITDTVEEEGVYLYRVVAERPSATPDGEPHVVPGTEDDVRVGEPPATTTSGPSVTQPTTTITVPRLNTGGTRDRVSTSRNVNPVQPSAPTTIDTGFERTLNYGDEEPGEEAAEGQSVINSDDDGVVGPGAAAAAALVLVGWAGHIFYFRRLAAQF